MATDEEGEREQNRKGSCWRLEMKAGQPVKARREGQRCGRMQRPERFVTNFWSETEKSVAQQHKQMDWRWQMGCTSHRELGKRHNCRF